MFIVFLHQNNCATRGVSSVVERLLRMLEAAGSNPALSIECAFSETLFLFQHFFGRWPLVQASMSGWELRMRVCMANALLSRDNEASFFAVYRCCRARRVAGFLESIQHPGTPILNWGGGGEKEEQQVHQAPWTKTVAPRVVGYLLLYQISVAWLSAA
jgi:hypothetical protein